MCDYGLDWVSYEMFSCFFVVYDAGLLRLGR